MERVWIRSVNWLGDSVMALPALAAFRAAHPCVRVGLGSPPGLIPFWRLCGVADDLFALEKGWNAEWRMACTIRGWKPDRVVIFPNSFRSAWVPFLSGVKERVGAPGRFRRFLLTRVVRIVGEGHQALVYYDLLGIPRPDGLPEVRGLISVPAKLRERVLDTVRRRILGGVFPRPGEGGGWLAVLPGAARGASKRWPVERFAAAAARVAGARGMGVVVCGSPAEEALCRQVADALGGMAVSMAGQTDVAELAAVLSLCRAVLCNDSGGMHLAAAVGTPVVAVFGTTDPARTGPLGAGHRILMAPGVERSDVVARQSGKARAALEKVTVDAVVGALEALLDVPGKE